MSKTKIAASSMSTGSDGVTTLLRQYGFDPLEFTGGDNALYERHFVFDNVVKPTANGLCECFQRALTLRI